MNFYDITVKHPSGEMISMKDYEGKVVLVINSATGCGFTPQYTELEALYEKYKEEGFIILDFPCNQFMNQAPGNDEEIKEFCNSRYNVTFPIFSKVEVNGENEASIFKFLKEALPFEGKGLKMKLLAKLSKTSKSKGDIRWNFTKFLIDRNGNPIKRFEPTDKLSLIEDKLKELL
jgi:glutathione peroxidase